ncbi:SAV_6107 family HEPN domain-containing protein [Corynebacterium kozikiae]|uniref:SAV_6107 family HEPN domain-containing protein n=1 Tax=Corynebacterium kozikiae TaxID=2968469 RepID=UPI00211BC3BC|nr:SAV_6107 family HEPN domain-containing protein [Corynebacterium sp. 76QC2CO]MCQ9342275.1 SAV_6107 family HEPN domain-containing protein [Corynebacterium sp. 76QC2CO]
MSTIVSATTSAMRGGNGASKKQRLVVNAEYLLAESSKSLQAGDQVCAFDYAYQASLRLAGARIAESPVAKRVRKPSGAWDQLRMVDAQAAQWADVFQPYSQTHRRMISGLSHTMTAERILAFQYKVWEFHAELTGMQEGPVAA